MSVYKKNAALNVPRDCVDDYAIVIVAQRQSRHVRRPSVSGATGGNDVIGDRRRLRHDACGVCPPDENPRRALSMRTCMHIDIII